MPRPVLTFDLSKMVRPTTLVAVALAMLCTARHSVAQNTPLLSGGVGFLSNTNGGKTTYTPFIEPLLAAPIGPHLLIESRAALTEAFAPKGGGEPGYNHTRFIGLTYLQGDYIALSHVTIVGGTFLLPFGTYNERLSPFWVGNLQAGPLIAGLGLQSSGIGTGGMLRGSAISHRKYSIQYATYFSARSGYQQFTSKRSAGGQTSLYLPEQGLEIGFSYNRLLQGPPASHENFYGTHVWWEPKDTSFRLRSEFARGGHAQGYWIEADYRSRAFGGLDSAIGRIEPVFRLQQTFRLDTLISDGVAAVNTQRADFGLDYNLPHNTRILTSYSRQFASTGNRNIWQTAIVYRFLFPTWRGK
jgi:hypothetical protein